MPVSPVLRWAGSKRKLIPQLVRHVPVEYGCYYEPFAGSACLFFNIAPADAVIGDFNPEVMHLYRTIKRAHKKLSKLMTQMPCSAKFYYRLRSMAPESLPSIERAARFLYLNRYCFNGVYRTNRAGQFNVPRGRHTGSLPDGRSLAECATALRRTRLIEGDFIATLAGVQQGDFVYVDPPYAKAGRPGYGEYGYGTFDESDCPRLVARLRELTRDGAHILLSYSADSEIELELTGWAVTQVSVRRHVAGFGDKRGVVQEVLLSNRPLITRER
jgi:DNA adenine methylase